MRYRPSIYQAAVTEGNHGGSGSAQQFEMVKWWRGVGAAHCGQ